MKKTLFLVVLVAALTLPVAALFAAGQGESAAPTGSRYPETVDPFAPYPETVTATFAKEMNEAQDFPQGDSYGKNVWTRSILKDLNLNLVLKFEALAGEKFTTKMNLAIASNDLPDILTLVNATQFNRLVQAGKLEDLTEVYEKFAYPYLKKCYMEDGGVRKSWGTVGGKLYGIAIEGVSYQSPRMIFIRRDWREKLGIPEPKTMNDVLDMARAFKKVDPKNRYGILLTSAILDNGMSDITAVANSMGVFPRTWIKAPDGKLIYGSVQPGMKEVLRIYRDLYRDGLINPEFATTDGGASAPQLTNGQVGIAPNSFWLFSWPLNSLYDREGVEWDAYPVLPMKGYEGKLKVQTDNVSRRMYAVRKGYSHPEALMKVLDYETAKLSDPELAGDPKVFHSDDTYQYHMMMPFYPAFSPLRINLDTNPHVTQAIDKKDTSFLVTPHDHLQYGRVKAYFDAVNAGKKPNAADWVAYRFFYGPTSAFGVLNYYWDNDLFYTSPATGIVTEEMARKQGTLNKLEEQYYVQIITGKKPLDAFDQWVQDWQNLGGKTIEEEINAWYASTGAR